MRRKDFLYFSLSDLENEISVNFIAAADSKEARGLALRTCGDGQSEQNLQQSSGSSTSETSGSSVDSSLRLSELPFDSGFRIRTVGSHSQTTFSDTVSTDGTDRVSYITNF